jgi:hypothetical protein
MLLSTEDLAQRNARAVRLFRSLRINIRFSQSLARLLGNILGRQGRSVLQRDDVNDIDAPTLTQMSRHTLGGDVCAFPVFVPHKMLAAVGEISGDP